MRFWLKSRNRRRLLWVLATGLFVSVALLVVLRLPAVQVRVLRWAAAGGNGWRLDVARVSIGLGGGEASGLSFSMAGIVARTEPGVTVRVRPGRFLFGGRELHVERVEAEGVRIVVTPEEMNSVASAESAPFAGVLAELQSPLPWVLGAANIGAEIEVREAGAELATARLHVEGGGLSPTTAGEFLYELEVASRLLPPGPDAVVRSRGTVRVRQSATHGVAAVEVRGNLRLPVYGLVKLPTAEFTLTVVETAAGERYSGAVRFGAEGAAENVTVIFSADFDRAKRVVSGRLDVGADTQALAWAGLAMEAVPVARVLGAGTFSVGVDSGAISGRFTAGTAAARECLTVTTDDGVTARVELRELPLDGLASWGEAQGIRARKAQASGVWLVRRDGTSKVFLDTEKSLDVGPIAWSDGLEPAMPDVHVRVDVAIEATKERVRWELHSLRVGTVAAGGLEARVSGQGEWSLADASGGSIEAAKLELLVEEGEAEPALTLVQGGVLRIDAAGVPQWTAGDEVAKISVHALPLSWVSRWLQGETLTGIWSEGESTMKVAEPAGGFALSTERAWRFHGLRLEDAAGAVVISGDAEFRPGARRSADGRWTGGVDGLSTKDADGRALSGNVAGSWAEADGAYQVIMALRAELPAGEVAPNEFGALEVELHAKAGSLAPKVGQIENILFTVKNAGGELVALRGDGGWLYAQRPNGEVVVNSLAGWKLTTATLPLAHLKDFFPPGLEMEGVIEPTEFLVQAEMGFWRVRPLRPLVVRGLTVKRDDEELARAVDISFYPGLDLRVSHALKPAFQLAWEASLHATEGRVETAAGRAVEFEAAIGAMGDLERTLPKTVDLVARGDLAVARVGFPQATAGLPDEGKFTVRIDGDLLGSAPVEAWARLEAVPAAEEGRPWLAPLELSARGKVNGAARTAAFDVALRMGEGGAAGDLAFAVTLALEDATLRLDSALRGKRWDVTESLAWARVMGGGRESDKSAKKDIIPAKNAMAMTPVGSAFWGPLRGHFELDIGELWMAPYRVENLRGQVNLEERELVVSELGGEMFSGRLGGGFRMNYEPGAEGGDHALAGTLRIEQFDTARVVQTVFENDYGSLDAKVDLRAVVRGRGFRLADLTERAEVDFAVNGKGVARLTHPDAGTASTLLVMGGVLTLSPELRALGRLLRKFAEMPLDDLSIEGGRAADGTVRLSRVKLDSPQLRLEGAGQIAAVEGVPLPARDLLLTLSLAARNEMGVILGRMRLLEKKTDADGFRRLNQTVAVKGQAGRPDPSELYDLFARGAAGSRGTWGLIMRKVQRELEKQQRLGAKTTAEEATK